MESRGRAIDTSTIRARSIARKRARSEDDGMQVDDSTTRSVSRLRSQSRVAARDRSTMGLRNVKQKTDADIMKKKTQTKGNMMGKRGESDRAIMTKMPKHLFAGKRGFQADRR